MLYLNFVKSIPLTLLEYINLQHFSRSLYLGSIHQFCCVLFKLTCTYSFQSICMCRSRIICQGRSRPDSQKTVWTTFFFVFLVLNLFYSLQRGSKCFITEKTILFQGSRGGPTFSRGGGGGQLFFYGRSNANFYRKPYNFCFSRGGGGVQTPYRPLWIRT